MPAGYKVSVEEWAGGMAILANQKPAETFTVLGRPAVFGSSNTMRFSMNSANGGSADGNGPMARILYMAQGKGDRGGIYHLAVWSKSGPCPPTRP
ncbi:hypothetical protein [Streptomyces monashensis]|uniref:hypothetical protein n=1 Tax=Streptomyces monashensis TaxID=1678012 RepID=UPI001160619D|nr:hypothetical protein [Streptomyces monashensis]